MPFAQGDVVVLPFPYSGRLAEKRRPGLIVSKPSLERGHAVLWVAMITSDRGGARPDDVAIKDLRKAGLPAPSLVRPSKLATVEPARVLRKSGALSAAQLKHVIDAIAAWL